MENITDTFGPASAASHRPIDENTERFYASYSDIDGLMRIQSELTESKDASNAWLTKSPAAIIVLRTEAAVSSTSNRSIEHGGDHGKLIEGLLTVPFEIF